MPCDNCINFKRDGEIFDFSSIVLAAKFHPYLTMRWVTMVKGQWVIVLKERTVKFRIHDQLFCTFTLYLLSFFPFIWLYSIVGLLSTNQISSAGDTLHPGPSSRSFVWLEKHCDNRERTGRKREGCYWVSLIINGWEVSCCWFHKHWCNLQLVS